MSSRTPASAAHLLLLFPFYFLIVTSFRSNAKLYNLKSIPFWIQSGVVMDHYNLCSRRPTSDLMKNRIRRDYRHRGLRGQI
jgi:ABC-type glycerol-3-phosphate transport system permease component